MLPVWAGAGLCLLVGLSLMILVDRADARFVERVYGGGL